MAVSVNATGSEGGSAGAAVTSLDYTGITVASGTDTVLIFCCGFSNPSISGVTATWDNGGTNQSMTLIASQGATVFNNGPPVYVFGLLNPTTGNKTLHLSWTTSSEICGAALAYDGVDTSSFAAAFTNVNKAGNTSANPTVVVTSATDDAAVASVLSTNGLSAPTQTSVFLESGFTYSNAYAMQRAVGAASVSLGWTGPSANNAIIGFNVVASSGGAALPIGRVHLHNIDDGIARAYKCSSGLHPITHGIIG